MKRRLAGILALAVALAIAQPAAAAGAKFSDATEAAGLPTDAHTSWGTSIADVNGDGWPDMLLGRHTQPPALFMGSATGFIEDTDITWPTPMDRHNCAWGEANGDGRPDLLCAQGAMNGEGEGPNELWLNTVDGFVESADAYGLKQTPYRGRTSTWIDFDRDGDLDIFFGSAPREGYPDVTFRNDAGTFVETITGIEGSRDTENATWADWDGNGYPDLLLTSILNKPLAFTNSGGTFSPVTIPALGTRKWYGSAWADINGDGQPDLAVIDPHYVRILRNDAGTFTKIKSLQLAYGRGLAWVDLNNDGRLDLYVSRTALTEDPSTKVDRGDVLLMATSSGGYTLVKPAELTGWQGSGEAVAVLDYNQDLRMDVMVSNGRARWPGKPVLLENVFATKNAAAIRLRGPDWNPLGMGAVIQLTTAAFSYRRETNDGVTWAAQSDAAYVHLGLRTQSTGSVRITWPDGTADCVTVNAGTVTEVAIGTSPCV
ncbi:MAG TPA: CRTAC1 family protein [Candidatus Limnocylindria bacterium]|nr:CRTAC1 family protein [Candidatus Limnocylindria bacterium]